MGEQEQSLQDLKHIKEMMEGSRRFVRLSGFSGIAAGICTLAGAVVAYPCVHARKNLFIDADKDFELARAGDSRMILYTWLFWIAAFTFIDVLVTAFIFG